MRVKSNTPKWRANPDAAGPQAGGEVREEGLGAPHFGGAFFEHRTLIPGDGPFQKEMRR